LDDHFNGAIGSPLVDGSTMASMARTFSGCLIARLFLPPPERRCRLAIRSAYSRPSPLNCFTPAIIVAGPHFQRLGYCQNHTFRNPIPSLAVHNLLPRSSRKGRSLSYWATTTFCFSARTLLYRRVSSRLPFQMSTSGLRRPTKSLE
jgi:hypothetical protein